jgi:hypothetical protein
MSNRPVRGRSYMLLNIISVIKTKIIRREKHVARMEIKLHIYRILFLNAERRLLGILWEDNIKMVSVVFDTVYCVQLAHDRIVVVHYCIFV